MSFSDTLATLNRTGIVAHPSSSGEVIIRLKAMHTTRYTRWTVWVVGGYNKDFRDLEDARAYANSLWRTL